MSEPEARASAQATVDYANDNLDGMHGHKIVLDVCKEKEDPASALTCANQMVQDGVVAVLSPGTAQGSTIVPVITKAGIAHLTPNPTSAQEFTGKNSFVVTSGLPGQLTAAAAYAKRVGFKGVTLYAVDAGTLVATIRSFADPIFAAAGVKVTTQPIPPNTPDATAQVTAGLSGHPDAEWILADSNTCIAVLKALDVVGSKVQRWFIPSCVTPTVMKAVSPGNFANSIAIAANVDGTSSNDPEAVLYRAVMAKYAPGVTTGSAAPFGFMMVLALLRATQGITGDVTAASVLAAIQAAKDVPLPLGHGLTFTCDSKSVPTLPAVCGSGALVEHIENGKFTTVEAVS